MIISLEAEADLAEARAFYEGRRSGLGDAFLRSVEQALERSAARPKPNGSSTEEFVGP